MNRNATAIILIVLAIGIYFTFTDSQINSVRVSDIEGFDGIKSLMAKRDEYQKAIDNGNEIKKIRDKAQVVYKNISLEDRDRLDKMMPSSVDNIHLIVDVTNLARNVGVVMTNVKADVSQDQNSQMANAGGVNTGLPNFSLATVKLSFNVITTYDRFITFMEMLESSLRIMDVTKLDIKASDTGVYEFSVGVNTYYLRQ